MKIIIEMSYDANTFTGEIMRVFSPSEEVEVVVVESGKLLTGEVEGLCKLSPNYDDREERQIWAF